MHATDLSFEPFHFGQVVEGFNHTQNVTLSVAHQGCAESEGNRAAVQPVVLFFLVGESGSGLQRVKS